MKKIITLLLLVLATQMAFGQKCKFEINEVDEFTGARKIRTLATKLNSAFNMGFNVHIALAQVDSISAIYVVLNTISPTVISEGNKVYFKLNDGSIVNTESPRTNLNIKGYNTQIGQVNISSYSLTNIYPISVEILEQMLEKGLAKVRVETSEGHLECEIVDRAKKQFTKTATCFLNEVKAIQ